MADHDFDFYTRRCVCGVGEADQMKNPTTCRGVTGQPHGNGASTKAMSKPSDSRGTEEKTL